MRHPMTLGVLATLAFAAASLGGEALASAADPVAACIASNEQALDLRDQGKLLDARGRFALCAASTCPDAIQQACRGRIAELNASIPSVVFDVKDGAGRDVADVKLAVDGQPAGTVGVTAIELNPGQHSFHFEAPGYPSADRALLLREGEKEKHETIVLGGAADQGAPRSASIDRRTVGWIVGGVGVLAVVTGGVLALVAKSSYDGAAGCSGTTCADQGGIDKSNSARNLGNVATVLFIAGGVVAATGAVLWLTAPARDQGTVGEAKQASWSIGVTPGGAAVRGRF